MTEEQAKTKWCPMVRVGDGSGCNRNHLFESYDKCIASDCMMWVPERRSKEGSMTVVDGGHCGLRR